MHYAHILAIHRASPLCSIGSKFIVVSLLHLHSLEFWRTIADVMWRYECHSIIRVQTLVGQWRSWPRMSRSRSLNVSVWYSICRAVSTTAPEKLKSMYKSYVIIVAVVPLRLLSRRCNPCEQQNLGIAAICGLAVSFHFPKHQLRFPGYQINCVSEWVSPRFFSTG